MSHSNKKLLISEFDQGLFERFILSMHRFLGYEILIFSKSNKPINLSKYTCHNYSKLSKYDFSIFFHRKAEWAEKLYWEVFANKEINVKKTTESNKFRILIKDIFQRSIGSFDDLMYLAELKKKKYDHVKIRCSWNLVRSETLKKCIFKNDIFVSFSFVGAFLQLIRKKNIKLISLTKKTFSLFRGKSESKSDFKKNSSKVIFFPHKGISFGDSFQKDYYYSGESSSPLNKKNILHLEYSAFDSSIEKNYVANKLEFDFIKKPKVIDLLKFSFFNKNFKLKKLSRDLNWNILSFKAGILFLTSNIVAEFLVDFYIKKLSVYSDCKFALLGYDVLFPKEISLALLKLKIETIAIQERYTLPHAGNYNVLVDYYFVWGYQTEKMINQSIGESYIGKYIITGPPRSDKIKRENNKLLNNSRKKYIVYSNAPESNIYINNNVLLNSWVNINALLEDVLLLAEKHADCDFIIRAKHTGWNKISYFSKILLDLSHKKNIEIVDDYDTFDISYSLLKDAHGVIGHHTSIADEAMCYGIPVLFHDFGPYAESIYAQNYNYGDLDIFTKSSEDFQTKFIKFFKDNQYPSEFQHYVDKTFGDLGDNSVMKRISYSLNEIIGEV